MWQSAKEYIVLTVKTLSSYLTLFATIVFFVLKFWADLAVPYWIIAIIILLGLLMGQFTAFHRVRLERNILKETRPAIEVEPK